MRFVHRSVVAATALLGPALLGSALLHGPAAAQTLGPRQSGTGAERLWLLGGLALSLAAAGIVAYAAARGRRGAGAAAGTRPE
ncbi:hypothetical protein [Streptomyces sp. NPDC001985]|uniref:hypothetical protein n=1 Tax=Streptomyces sp. NPDC001985 TaxID=3154406 RepID=UPI003316D5CC